MVKKALKNFFCSFLYMFIPMGILYLFILIALFYLAVTVLGGAGTMLTSLTALIESTVEESQVSVTAFLSYAIKEIDWSGSFFAAIRQIISTNWIQRTVLNFFEMLGGSSAEFSGQVSVIVADFSETVHVAVAVASSWTALGLTLANFATRFVVRRKNAKRSVGKWIAANTVLPLVQSAIVIGTIWLAFAVRYFTLLVVFLLLVAYGFVSLVSAWLLHGRKKIPYKTVVNGKNIAYQLLSALLIVLVVAAIFAAVFFVNALIAVLVLIPLVIYAINIISVNADAYVCDLIANTEKDAQAPAQAPAEAVEVALPAAETEQNAEPAEAAEVAPPAEGAEGTAADSREGTNG